jgi:hypothetical protein
MRSERGPWIVAFALPLALALALLVWTRLEQAELVSAATSPVQAPTTNTHTHTQAAVDATEPAPRRERSAIPGLPTPQRRAAAVAAIGRLLERNQLQVLATANVDASEPLPLCSEQLQAELRAAQLPALQLYRVDVRGTFANLHAAARELSAPDSGVLLFGTELELGRDPSKLSTLDGKLWIWI